MPPISPGFRGRPRADVDPRRLPPGQHLTTDFPVLSAGPTPHVPEAEWSFTIRGAVDAQRRWDWAQFSDLPAQDWLADIHCVTTWSKLDTRWHGVSLDALLATVAVDDDAAYLSAFCDGGYTTNLPLDEVIGGQAFIATRFNGDPLAAEHGGPARLVVPHRYFWKSAKWVRGLELTVEDQPGFWERAGYNNHADPWREERYWGD